MTWDASAEGICREVAALACHPALCNAPDGLLLENGQKLCAAVSGMWCREDLRTLWGENFAVAALPRLEDTPMGFFAIYDLLGVNAHSRQLYWAAAFARHLTGEDSLRRSGEGSADPVLQALTQQSQGGIIVPAGDNFWTPMSRLLGKLSSEAGEAPDWAALLAECADAMNK